MNRKNTMRKKRMKKKSKIFYDKYLIGDSILEEFTYLPERRFRQVLF